MQFILVLSFYYIKELDKQNQSLDCIRTTKRANHNQFYDRNRFRLFKLQTLIDR